MNKIITLAAASLLCASCFQVNTNFKGGKNAIKGEGDIVTQSFDLKDFHSIRVNGNADIVFAQAESWDVTVTTQQSVMDQLDYQVEDSVLVIRARDNRPVNATKYEVAVSAPDLKDIEINGAAEFNAPDGIRSEKLNIQVNGASDLNFEGINCPDVTIQCNGAADLDASDIYVQTLKVEINGAGDVVLAGRAADVDLSVNGAGDIDARELIVTGKAKKHAAGIAKILMNS